MDHDPKVEERPGKARDGEGRPAPKFGTEEAARRRQAGQRRRSVGDIVDDAFVQHAETLKRLGE
ncbi:hypothetical protein [Stappia indica]|uniref:hypothetical protein n=1 Tax=Stappia indica TaxID=538381 RepID=UPI001D18AEAC|nr:hypothetical protein [Stappia indica]MCC4243542.1 hypothetical protein [Stappia indica]